MNNTVKTFLPLLNGYYDLYIPKLNLRRKDSKREAQPYNLNKQPRGRVFSKYRTLY